MLKPIHSESETTQSDSESWDSPQPRPQGCMSSKLKIELCRNFVEKGYCIYRERCNFAHGYQELCINNTNAHKLKTNVCRHFQNTMLCRFGQRCNFIHYSQTGVNKRNFLRNVL